LKPSPNFVRIIKSIRRRGAVYVARMAEVRDLYKILGGNPVGKRQLRRPKRRWENNIRMNLVEIGWEVVGWMHLV
jgi:hypothetical protein